VPCLAPMIMCMSSGAVVSRVYCTTGLPAGTVRGAVRVRGFVSIYLFTGASERHTVLGAVRRLREWIQWGNFPSFSPSLPSGYPPGLAPLHCSLATQRPRGRFLSIDCLLTYLLLWIRAKRRRPRPRQSVATLPVWLLYDVAGATLRFDE